MTCEHGSHRRFEQFFLDEHPKLVWFGLAWTGDRVVAQALALDSLARAHRSWSTVALLDLPGAWLRRLMISLLTEHDRDAARRRRPTGQPGPAPTLDPPDGGGGVWWPTVRALPARERAVVTLHHLEDMSIANIAAILEVKPGTVKAALANAQETLRLALADAEGSQLSTPLDDELDAIGRRAGAQLRAEARAVANSADALRALLAGIDTPAPAPRLAPLAQPRSYRRLRARLAVVGAIATLVAGVGHALIGTAGWIDIASPTRAGSGAPGMPDGSTPSSNPPAAGPTTTNSSVPDSLVPGSSVPGSSVPGSSVPDTAPSGGRDLTIPSMPQVSLDDVPALLPEPPPPPDRTYRSAWKHQFGPVFNQTWIRTDASARVTAIVQIETRFEEMPIRPGSHPVDVPGWTAVMIPVDGDVAQILLAGENHTVSVSAYGLRDEATLEVARSLRTERGDHWVSPALAGTGWTEFERSWTTGIAVRSLTTLDAHLDVETEISVSRGLTLLEQIPDREQLDGGLRLVDVAGSPAILGRGSSSALVIRGEDGTAVVLGSRDPDADLVAWAETLTDVGAAAWGAAGRAWPPGTDD